MTIVSLIISHWCSQEGARVALPCRGAGCTPTVRVLPRRRARHG